MFKSQLRYTDGKTLQAHAQAFLQASSERPSALAFLVIISSLRAAAFQVAFLCWFAIEAVKLENRRHPAGDFERQCDSKLGISTAEAFVRKDVSEL